MVALANPYSGTVLDVAEDLVERYTEAGWYEPGNEPEPGNGGGQGDLFDPSEHNADEVNAYLDKADDVERERVLAAEREGKKRKGVLGDD